VAQATTGITHLTDTKAFLAAYHGKLIHCRTQRDIRRTLEQVAAAVEVQTNRSDERN
jgi:hypothetical protein